MKSSKATSPKLHPTAFIDARTLPSITFIGAHAAKESLWTKINYREFSASPVLHPDTFIDAQSLRSMDALKIDARAGNQTL